MKLLLILLAQIPWMLFSQNPLKKAMENVGNTQSVHYSKSGYNFENNYSQTIFIGELNDNRVGNWNKQLNDTIRIEPIRDYWSFPYKFLFKEKISKDLAFQKFVIGELKDAADFTVLPTVEIHFPNFISYPSPGYWVLTRVSFDVEKKKEVKLQKAYENYFFFGKGHPDYKPEYNTNYKEGTNVAMWVGMKNVLDKFYKDLDNILVGKEVPKDSIPLKVYSIASNVNKDDAIVKSQKPYSSVDDKDKFKSTKDPKSSDKDEYNMESNYKMDSAKELPPPVDSKLEKAIAGIPIKKDTPITTLVKNVPKPNKVNTDSVKKAIIAKATKEKEIKIDSFLIKKEQEAKLAKEKQEKEKLLAAELVKLQKAKVDSIKKATLALQNEKMKDKMQADSLKKLEVNKKMELANKKKEEERQKLELLAKAREEKILAYKKSDSLKRLKAETVVTTKSVTPSIPVNTTPTRRNGEDIAAAMRRIAAEVEAEELRNNPPKPVVPKEKATSIKNAAVEAASKKPEGKVNSVSELTQKEKEDSETKNPKQKKQKEITEIATMPIIPVNYKEDSIKLELEKQKKREAIIAAQKAAFEAEKLALSKDPDAGKLFATVSTDPPSKMPDARTPEQRKADRIFVPKNVVSKDLLDRVKLITPEEEAKILAKFNTEDKSVIDSIFIKEQANRPKPAPVEPKVVAPVKMDTVKATKVVDTAKSKGKVADIKTAVDKTKEVKKDELINKGLKKADDIKKSADKVSDTSKSSIKKLIQDNKAKAVQKTMDTVAKAKSIIKPIDTAKSKVSNITAPAKSTITPIKKDAAATKTAVDTTASKIKKLVTDVAPKTGK